MIVINFRGNMYLILIQGSIYEKMNLSIDENHP